MKVFRQVGVKHPEPPTAPPQEDYAINKTHQRSLPLQTLEPAR